MIIVLAGVNGAGKSSIGGSALRASGQDWYNPDEVARDLHQRYPNRPLTEINGAVWREGLLRLHWAIQNDTNFAFETTLGGNTITAALLDAIAAGIRVDVWYCGLASVELHVQRVAERVGRGGHDIPEALIRQRFKRSTRNLCRLTPGLHQLAVFDNSLPLDGSGKPRLEKLIHCRDGQLIRCKTVDMPNWAKPVAAVCLQHCRS